MALLRRSIPSGLVERPTLDVHVEPGDVVLRHDLLVGGGDRADVLARSRRSRCHPGRRSSRRTTGSRRRRAPRRDCDVRRGTGRRRPSGRSQCRSSASVHEVLPRRLEEREREVPRPRLLRDRRDRSRRSRSRSTARTCAGNGTAAVAALDPVNAGPGERGEGDQHHHDGTRSLHRHQLPKLLRDLASGCRPNALRPAVERSTSPSNPLTERFPRRRMTEPGRRRCPALNDRAEEASHCARCGEATFPWFASCWPRSDRPASIASNT